MGLVAAPSRRLTVEEWAEVKTRSIEEEDSNQPCVICREEFRLQPQVTAFRGIVTVCALSFLSHMNAFKYIWESSAVIIVGTKLTLSKSCQLLVNFTILEPKEAI